MNKGLMSSRHNKDCVARILNNCWHQTNQCYKGDQCDEMRSPYTGCSSECKIKKEWDEKK